MRIPLALVALVAPLLLPGCSSSSYQTVPLADATGRPVAPDMCRVYVARSGQMTGSVRTVELRVGGETIAELGSGGYVCMDRPASRVVVNVVYHGPVVDQRLDGGAVEDVLSFEGEPGVTYYYRLHLEPSSKMPTFERLSAEAGRALVADRDPADVRN